MGTRYFSLSLFLLLLLFLTNLFRAIETDRPTDLTVAIHLTAAAAAAAEEK